MIKSNISKYFITALMMFVTVFIYSILKSVKDAVLISHMSVELISTTKLYGVLPSAILFTIIYTRFTEYISRLNIYYLFNLFFISFFIIYSILIYPNAVTLTPDLSFLKEIMPFFRYVFTMLEGWVYAIFYIISELWGNIMIALMFWQFQNQIHNVYEAKKLYPILIFIGEMGAVTGAWVITFMHDMLIKEHSWYNLFYAITAIIVIASIILSIMIWLLSNKILSKDIINKKYEINSQIIGASFKEKIKYIMSSNIFRLIACLIICYGVSINLVEGIWKKYINLLYSTPEEILYFMSKMEFYRGMSGFITTFIAVIILKRFSWRINALLTPLCFMFLVLIFAISIYNKNYSMIVANYFSVIVLQVIVIVGAIQNIITKATKYEFFEPTKEIAYISVDEELRTKGKAIVEIIGARFGKSSGAAIQWLLLTIFAGSTLTDLTHIMFILCFITLVIWLLCTLKLSNEIENKRGLVVNDNEASMQVREAL